MYIGDQIVDSEVYIKCGLTTDLNRFKNISLSMKVNVRKIRPTFLFEIEKKLIYRLCALLKSACAFIKAGQNVTIFCPLWLGTETACTCVGFV